MKKPIAFGGLLCCSKEFSPTLFQFQFGVLIDRFVLAYCHVDRPASLTSLVERSLQSVDMVGTLLLFLCWCGHDVTFVLYMYHLLYGKYRHLHDTSLSTHNSPYHIGMCEVLY